MENLTEEEKVKKWEEFDKNMQDFIRFAENSGFTKEQAQFLFSEIGTIKSVLGIKF